MSLDELKAEILGDWPQVGGNLTFGRPPSASSTVCAGNTTALTLIGPRLLDEFRSLIEQAVRDNIPGDIMETGVWRGGACIWAAAVLEHLDSNKLVYVCDSFQGLPPAVHPKETIDFSDETQLAVPLEQVEANFAKYGLLHRAVFVKGWFKDTMPTLDVPVAVLRLDGDMYESTRDVLNHMYGRVSPGGYVIVDDYRLPSCHQAVNEFRSRHHIRGGLAVRDGVWWQK